jgi:predicted ATPase
MIPSHGQLNHVSFSGFKSIAECDLELNRVNILIGANGAGKSNFIAFFKFIKTILDSNLQRYVGQQGGPDSLLHFGRKKTSEIKASLSFRNKGYTFALEPTQDNHLMFTQEAFIHNFEAMQPSSVHLETHVGHKRKFATFLYEYVVPVMKNWRVYHFQDTGDSSPLKTLQALNNNLYLREDGSNLAAFLYFLKEKYTNSYSEIVKTIRLVAPFFGDFLLRPSPFNDNQIELEWTEIGQDVPFKAYQLSDGTLRFIGLATVLLQPRELQPETIIVDEPELGLHPYAIKVLAALIKNAACNRQLIVSTQSVELLDEFEPNDIIVVERHNDASTFRRLESKDLSEWLEDYSLGELWKKNILGGRPSK